MNCTFFGNRNCDNAIYKKLKETIIMLITKEKVNTFFVGTHGNFDMLVFNVLKEIENSYNIKYFKVLSKIPLNKDYDAEKYDKTIVPTGLENVPPKFTIIFRNKWMIENSEFVVTHIPYSAASNSREMRELAIKRNKTVIDI